MCARAVNLPSLATERLTLSLLAPGKDTAMCEFMATNAPHLAPWETLPPDGSDSLGRWRATCVRSAEEFASGQAVRLTAALHSAPETIIACINFTQISRGPFQACFLGYKIGQNQQGQGLMSEALRAATRYMFDVQDLHRIHANYMPHNVRSGRLLARLGFVIEGYARDYLLINGAWRDHVLTSLTQYRPTRSWTI